PAASGPVFTVKTPTFMGAFWAIDGIGNPAAPVAAAAVPAMNVRRLSRKTIFFLPLGRHCLCRRSAAGAGCAGLRLARRPSVRARSLPLRQLQYDLRATTSGYLPLAYTFPVPRC